MSFSYRYKSWLLLLCLFLGVRFVCESLALVGPLLCWVHSVANGANKVAARVGHRQARAWQRDSVKNKVGFLYKKSLWIARCFELTFGFF